MTSLVSLLVNLPSFTNQPAVSNNRLAWRSWRRDLPDPSVSGSLNSFVNVSAGIWPLNGSRNFNSAPVGILVAASSEFEK